MQNLFLDLNDQNGNNNNQPQQNLLNLNDNQNQNNNIMDLFNSGSSNNLSNLSSNNIVRQQNNMNLNINRSNSSNLYFSPQPMHSGGLNNIFQQMPINNKLNLQKNNNMNMGINNNNMMMNVNKMNSMQTLAATDFNFDVTIFVREHVFPREIEFVRQTVRRFDGLAVAIRAEHVMPQRLHLRILTQVAVKFRNHDFLRRLFFF